MRRNLLVAVLVGAGSVFSLWCVATAQGQARSNNSAAFEARVALVDLAYVFKKYDKFNKLTDQMKADVKAKETEITDSQQQLKSLLNQRSQYTPDSQPHKDLDKKIAEKKAEIELMTDRARKEFTQREASIYHQTYQEVEAAIKRYAAANGITLVLRSSRDEEISPSNPQDVIKEVSQQVIFSMPQMDITEQILAMLNPASLAPTVQPNTPTRPNQEIPRVTTPQLDRSKTQKR